MGAVTEDAFCLKWNDFHTSLTSSFAELREESDLLDATVVCDGTPMRAHKLVLSACSGVFRQLFRSSSSALGFAQGYTLLREWLLLRYELRIVSNLNYYRNIFEYYIYYGYSINLPIPIFLNKPPQIMHTQNHIAHRFPVILITIQSFYCGM